MLKISLSTCVQIMGSLGFVVKLFAQLRFGFDSQLDIPIMKNTGINGQPGKAIQVS
jgi:hypothetical protein